MEQGQEHRGTVEGAGRVRRDHRAVARPLLGRRVKGGLGRACSCNETSPGSGEATLILNNQQITSIAPGAFAGLSGLTGLYLFSNQISSQKTNKKNIAGGYDRRGSRALGTRQPVAASTATARISCN